MWERFGTVQNYVEPFFGSGRVLLGCPRPLAETANDADGLLQTSGVRQRPTARRWHITPTGR